MVGVLIIVSNSFGSSRILGDLLAFFMTLMMAGIMVIYRKYPDTTAALPAALSSIILLPCAVLFSTPGDVLPNELPILALFGLVFAVASVTLSEGARRLPSAETALLSILEMPLAPILAVLILSEAPTPQARSGPAQPQRRAESRPADRSAAPGAAAATAAQSQQRSHRSSSQSSVICCLEDWTWPANGRASRRLVNWANC